MKVAKVDLFAKVGGERQCLMHHHINKLLDWGGEKDAKVFHLVSQRSPIDCY